MSGRAVDELRTARGRPARSLLAEDNPADVRLTREMLHESKGHNDLLVAHSAEEAEDGATRRDRRAASRPGAA